MHCKAPHIVRGGVGKGEMRKGAMAGHWRPHLWKGNNIAIFSAGFKLAYLGAWGDDDQRERRRRGFTKRTSPRCSVRTGTP